MTKKESATVAESDSAAPVEVTLVLLLLLLLLVYCDQSLSCISCTPRAHLASVSVCPRLADMAAKSTCQKIPPQWMSSLIDHVSSHSEMCTRWY